MLLVDLLDLVGGGIVRYCTTPEYHVSTCFQGASSHVIGDRVGFPGDMTVSDRVFGSSFCFAYILQSPINGLAGRAFVQPGDEANHQLAVAEYPCWFGKVVPGLAEFG